ncbi:MAG: hypothetical protein IPL31_17540 [Saprospiraceae bacterium]|nr:hypothetical protein [Saprospiraceae bacterium]
MINLFLDTEFTILNQGSQLISLALLDESGNKEFYAEFHDYKRGGMSPWVITSVVPNLFIKKESPIYTLSKMHLSGRTSEIRKALEIWLDQFAERDSNGHLVKGQDGEKPKKTVRI